MPAKSKVITEKDVLTNEVYGILKDTALRVKHNHTEIARLTDEFEADKKKLGTKCREIFFNDMGVAITDEGMEIMGEDAEVFGNHEFHTEEGQVTVNYSVMSKVMEHIDKKPASEVLKKIFKEDYGTLFQEVPRKTVEADEDMLAEIAREHPTMFHFSLKHDVAKEKLRDVYKVFPEMFDVSVENVESFEKEYPEKVTEVVGVKPTSRFIEKVSKLSEETLMDKPVRQFLAGMLNKIMKTKILCGNTSKKGKK